MKWRSCKLWFLPIPVPVFYTEKMAPDVGGYARLIWVCIRPKYQADEGIHQHELEHVRQFWALPILHGWLYQASDRYRLWAEARAYRIQMQHPDRNGVKLTLELAIIRLRSPRYQLHLSVEDARKALT